MKTMLKSLVIATTLLFVVCNANAFHHTTDGFTHSRFTNEFYHSDWDNGLNGAYLFLTVDTTPKTPAKKVVAPQGLEGMLGNQGRRQLPPPPTPLSQYGRVEMPQAQSAVPRQQYESPNAPMGSPSAAAAAAQHQSAVPRQQYTPGPVVPPPGTPQSQSALPRSIQSSPRQQYESTNAPLNGQPAPGQRTVSAPFNVQTNPAHLPNNFSDIANRKKEIDQANLKGKVSLMEARNKLLDAENNKQIEHRNKIEANKGILSKPIVTDQGKAVKKAQLDRNKLLIQENKNSEKTIKESKKIVKDLNNNSQKDHKPLDAEHKKKLDALNKEADKTVKADKKQKAKGKKGKH